MMSHDEATELLPWLVNGGLPEAERTRVSAHVDSCLLCRRAVQRERRLLALMAAEPAAEPAIDAGFRALLRRIDAQTAERPPRPGIPDRQFVPAWVYAALMLVGLGLAIWLATPRDTPEPTARFTTVLDGQVPSPNRIDVVFAADVGAEGRAAVAQEIGGRIVAGPSDAGRYTLELPLDAAVDVDVDVARTLERLRADARVRFAGRARAEPGDGR